VIAKVGHHLGELFPRVGFIATTLTETNRAVVRFYNQRGTTEQWITEDEEATHWTRLVCHRFRANEVRLLLGVIACNLGKATVQDGRTPHPACAGLHPATRRNLLDTAAVPADGGTHRAARVAPNTIERTASVRRQPDHSGSLSETGRQRRQTRGTCAINSDGAARAVRATDHKWPDGLPEASRGPLSKPREKRTWSISELPADSASTARSLSGVMTPPPSAPKRAPEIRALTGARVIPVMLIVLFHYHEWYG